MKNILLAFAMITLTFVHAQNQITDNQYHHPGFSKLTIEPGIGLQPMPISDLRLSNIIQYNLHSHLNFLSYSAYTRDNAFRRNFNHIVTNYSYSLSQLIGIGTSVYTKRSSHTFALLGGIRGESFKETLDNPIFDRVSATSNTVAPEFALMYLGKVGMKKYFFSYRVYLPLSPYPSYSLDINAMDANFSNVSLEIGIGIRL